jgi:hypothetical protein
MQVIGEERAFVREAPVDGVPEVYLTIQEA